MLRKDFRKIQPFSASMPNRPRRLQLAIGEYQRRGGPTQFVIVRVRSSDVGLPMDIGIGLPSNRVQHGTQQIENFDSSWRIIWMIELRNQNTTLLRQFFGRDKIDS